MSLVSCLPIRCGLLKTFVAFRLERLCSRQYIPSSTLCDPNTFTGRSFTIHSEKNLIKSSRPAGLTFSCCCAQLDGPIMEDSAMDIDSVSEAANAAISQPSDVQEFTASVKVEVPFLRFVTGKGGKTKEKIEKDTTTHLYVPLPHEVKHGSCLVVKGLSQDKVDKAVSQIHRVLQEAEESPYLEYSHFISLPLALHPALVEKVTRFHDSVLDLVPTKNNKEENESSMLCSETVETNYEVETTLSVTKTNKRVASLGQVDNAERIFADGIEQSKEEPHVYNDQEGTEIKDDSEISSLPLKTNHGIEESIFIKPATLHLTVLMLKLWSKERVAAAAEALKECMKGSPAKAHVLYARVEEANQENRLIRACKVIKDAFMEAGLVAEKDMNQELKLHATLMNTSHRKRKRGNRFGKRIPFDARQILFKHGLEDWGEHRIVEAHLSERFVFGEDGYYRCCGSIQFPPALAK